MKNRNQQLQGVVANFRTVEHPLADIAIAKIRHKGTSTADFRHSVRLISSLIGVEGLRSLRTQPAPVETPIETCAGHKHDSEVVFMPILRAGLAMLDPLLELVPHAGVGHIGMYRCETTLQPQSYFFKTPSLEEAQVFLLDPMLATGGSACDSVQKLKDEGAKHISMLCLIAAPEGVSRVASAHPDVTIIAGVLDRCLNERGYIMPGLGDAGDRFFLT
jgi:uracil phosphoribosyltransferase